MENLVFTQLSVPEVRQLFREELQNFFVQEKTISLKTEEIGGFNLATRITGLKLSDIRDLVQTDQIPFSRKGKNIYFRKSALLEWIHSSKRQTMPEKAVA